MKNIMRRRKEYILIQHANYEFYLTVCRVEDFAACFCNTEATFAYNKPLYANCTQVS